MLVANYLARTTDLRIGAFWLSVSFALSFALILGAIGLWQRAHGESLAELGWARPTRPLAVGLSVLLGLFWVAFCSAICPRPYCSPSWRGSTCWASAA